MRPVYNLIEKIRGLNWSNLIISISSFLFLLLLWEMISQIKLYNLYLFPPPSKIFSAFLQMAKSGEWLSDLFSSLFRYLTGFILGNLLGIILGFLTGRLPIIRYSLGPLLNFLRSTPSVALIPLAIVWFGIGDLEKIFIVAWGVTFPVWLNTYSGVTEVETEYIWAAQSLGANQFQIYYEIYFHRALPFIIAGSRMSVATGFFALAASEMSGAFSGIAFRIFHSHQMFQTDKMMVAILTIGLLGIISDRIFVWTMQWLLPWWNRDKNV